METLINFRRQGKRRRHGRLGVYSVFGRTRNLRVFAVFLILFLVSVAGGLCPAEAAGEPDTFISSWDTTEISNEGSSDADQINLPLEPHGNYDFTVDWGDDTKDKITSWNQDVVTHTYAEEGAYTVKITGTIEGWCFENGGDKLKLQEISQWGNLKWGNSGGYFAGTENLNITAEDVPDLTGTISMESAFSKSGISTVANISDWDVSNAKDMSKMFQYADSFNQDIGEWDVSNVVKMRYMFREADSFNRDIGEWDISRVSDMFGMFWDADSFNQDVGGWDVSRVRNMGYMFCGAKSFDQDIGVWDVSRVSDMWRMFGDADSFNQDISEWDVSRVKSMCRMFWRADSFNQDIGEWDVSRVRDMGQMFRDANSFNQDIGEWDVSNVERMGRMFDGASSFNQDIGDWDITSVEHMEGMFLEVKLSSENYDSLLTGWAKLDVNEGLKFHGGRSTYSENAADARQKLVDAYAWDITDGGLSGFISTWDTTEVYYTCPKHAGKYNKDKKSCDYRNCDRDVVLGSSHSDQINLPLVEDGVYDFTVKWGDGTEDHITSPDQDEVTHTYAREGKYTLWINGKLEGWSFGGSGESSPLQQRYGWPFGASGDMLKLQKISEWHNLKWGNAGGYFQGTENLSITAKDLPDLSAATTMENAFKNSGISSVPNMNDWDVSNTESMKSTFAGAEAFNQDIGNWDVRNVENMSGMFQGAASFNQDIGGWDVSNVRSMMAMFSGAASFNQDIGGWNVNNVRHMASMFHGAESFNQDIGEWDVSNVRSMLKMFEGAVSFNQDIGDWDVGNVSVLGMRRMFRDAKAFNQDIGGWDVSNVREMWEMFRGAESFNGDIGGWDVSNVHDMRWMFYNADAFNQDISDWDVSNVKIMSLMFYGAESFNQDIGEWDVSNVERMGGMFERAASFNQDIGGWNVSGVEDMRSMFWKAKSFNQDIGGWDVSTVNNMENMFRQADSFNQEIGKWNVGNVLSMGGMFFAADSFNQDLGAWDISNVRNMERMFHEVKLSPENYDSLLAGWAGRFVEENVAFDAGESQYSDQSANAREWLAEEYSWEITDGGRSDESATEGNAGMREVWFSISLLFLPVLALVVPAILLRQRLTNALWLKWAIIIAGVWLAQNVSFFLAKAIVEGLGPLQTFVAIWPQFFIWKELFRPFTELTDWVLFFFANLVFSFFIGAIIGLIIQRVKRSKSSP